MYIFDYYIRYRDFSSNYYNGVSARDQRRYEVQSLGPNSSSLVIRDYQSGLDDGIYRCFATRRNSFGIGTGMFKCFEFW